MLEMGIVVGLGLLVMYAKLSWRGRVWVNSHPLAMDVMVFAFLTAIHWGTFSGVMVAAVGALFCSIVIACARRIFGFMEGKQYVPGFMNVSAMLRN